MRFYRLLTKVVIITLLTLPLVVLHSNGQAAGSATMTPKQVLEGLSDGAIGTIAGSSSFIGDGELAVKARFYGSFDVALDRQGNIFIADTFHHRVRRVDAITGIITTVAGNGESGLGADGVIATSSELNQPMGIAFDSADNLYIADHGSRRIRRVDAKTCIITTVAGGGETFVEGSAATAVRLSTTHSCAIDSKGNLYITDRQVGFIRVVKAIAVGTN